MNARIILIAALLLPAAAVVQATDKVRMIQGLAVNGKITAISPGEVTVEYGTSEKKIPVIEIESIAFEAEPSELARVRAAVADGRYEDAMRLLSKLDASAIERPEIKQDIEFYKALAAARAALAGSGSIKEAGRQLLEFEKNNANSYHYFVACEALGDLLASLGNLDQAEKYYDKLEDAPWPEYKMRAGLLTGRALLDAKQYDKAAAKFDRVLHVDAKGKLADSNRLSATLGKASCQAGTGKLSDATRIVEDVISKADPEDQELHARAYNALGNCYKAANRKKDALLAFLHVDLLYSAVPDQHAEALANLATLWNEVNKADRAAQARNLLKERYPNSRWAQ
jgi:tetratricopeptide (TPR) repeat protein